MMRPQARRWCAWLSVFALLFQAVLLGWHHHPIELTAHGSAPLFAAAGSSPLSPAIDDDDHCAICLALHHLSAAPGELAALAAPGIIAAADFQPEPPLTARAAERGFQARAPPVA